MRLPDRDIDTGIVVELKVERLIRTVLFMDRFQTVVDTDAVVDVNRVIPFLHIGGHRFFDRVMDLFPGIVFNFRHDCLMGEKTPRRGEKFILGKECEILIRQENPARYLSLDALNGFERVKPFVPEPVPETEKIAFGSSRDGDFVRLVCKLPDEVGTDLAHQFGKILLGSLRNHVQDVPGGWEHGALHGGIRRQFGAFRHIEQLYRIAPEGVPFQFFPFVKNRRIEEAFEAFPAFLRENAQDHRLKEPDIIGKVAFFRRFALLLRIGTLE